MPYKPQIGLPHEKPKLKKALGLFEVTIYGVGIILGAGIYALIGEAAAVAGNALWIAFFVGAVIAAFTGLSYAELGTMYPKEAAEYVYSKKAFNSNLLSFLVGWLIIFVEIVAAATVALGFGGYFYSLTGFSPILSAIILIGILSFLNFWGIKESARFNVIFTLIEAAGLILIIVLGLNYFGSVNYFEAPQGFSGILMAAILVFFAYIGFEDMVNVAEETRKPRKVIPKALIISLIITTLVYMLVSIASVSVIPWNELGASSAPLAAVSEKAWTGSSSLLSIIALFATGNTVLILLIVTSRMIYGMADKKSLPKYLS
ncbi:MAG: APC family permease, partial [Methanosarcinales archaeon]